MILLPVALALQVAMVIIYGVFVWHRHRVRGSGFFLVALAVMVGERATGYLREFSDCGPLIVAVDNFLPALISSVFLVGAICLHFDLLRREARLIDVAESIKGV